MTPKELDFYCCLLNKRSRKRKKIDKCIQMIKLKTTNYNKNKKIYISKNNMKSFEIGDLAVEERCVGANEWNKIVIITG